MSEPALKRLVLCIGVGNPYRGDDAAGRVAARALQALHLPGVRVVEQNGEGTALLETWQGVPALILIDAVAASGTPGRIYRFDVSHQPLPARWFRCSTHTFGLAEAVEMARALGELPPQTLIYGIEGVAFNTGQELSAPVAAGILSLVEQVVQDVHRLQM